MINSLKTFYSWDRMLDVSVLLKENKTYLYKMQVHQSILYIVLNLATKEQTAIGYLLTDNQTTMLCLSDKKSILHCHKKDTCIDGRCCRRQYAIGTPFCVTIDFETLDDNKSNIYTTENGFGI